eukprot:scaffold294656_cov37-Tisochrysis_lutea.AAC.1
MGEGGRMGGVEKNLGLAQHGAALNLQVQRVPVAELSCRWSSPAHFHERRASSRCPAVAWTCAVIELRTQV